uniref:Uncharacterized protein n=1 Tax=Arundo donax TaxID=35708 RepID=A0A0A8ZBL8_ARUDO
MPLYSLQDIYQAVNKYGFTLKQWLHYVNATEELYITSSEENTLVLGCTMAESWREIQE